MIDDEQIVVADVDLKLKGPLVEIQRIDCSPPDLMGAMKNPMK